MYLWMSGWFVWVGLGKVSEGQSYAHASQFPRQNLFTGKDGKTDADIGAAQSESRE